MVTGRGIATGTALASSSLAELIVSMVPFEEFGAVNIILGISILCMVMATFMSHTATANLLMPIAISMSTSVASIEEIGGLVVIGTVVALASSLGMGLPISTPPNALAHATGLVDTKDFIKTAQLLSPIGVILIFAVMMLMTWLGFFWFFLNTSFIDDGSPQGVALRRECWRLSREAQSVLWLHKQTSQAFGDLSKIGFRRGDGLPC